MCISIQTMACDVTAPISVQHCWWWSFWSKFPIIVEIRTTREVIKYSQNAVDYVMV